MIRLATKRIPTAFNHYMYWEDLKAEEYGHHKERKKKGTTDHPEEGANLVSSQIVDSDDHTPMLDIDIPAFLIPSSTPGHSHLYIEKKMSWPKYKRLLKELARAGIIEEGYYRASVARKATFLRPPGVRK